MWKWLWMWEIKPFNPKGNQLRIFIGITDAEAPGLWPPDAKSWLFGKDPYAGKDWGQEEKRVTEDEMVGWHHQLNGHEFEQTVGDSEGQGSQACCSWWSAQSCTRLRDWITKDFKITSKQWNTWSNRQIRPWSTEWSRAKANRVLPRERTGHSKHPLPTTQEKTLHMDITRWPTPKSDWLYSLQPKMEKLYTVSKNKTMSWLWLRSWTPYCQIQTIIEESGENH